MRASASPKAPSTKRGLAERSEVWGSLRELLPPDRRWRSSPLYEEGGFFRCGGVRAEQSPVPTGTSKVQRKLGGLNPLSLRKAQTAPLDTIKGSLWAAQGVGDQKAQVPLRKRGTVRPSSQRASMERSAVPIMKSSWIMESFTPSARHSSSVLCSKSRMVSAKPMPSARWQQAFSSNSVL